MRNELYKKVMNFCLGLEASFDKIPAGRKAALEELAGYLVSCYVAGRKPGVVVVCTHNSRRSHLGQVFLAIGADYYGLPGLGTFSGGTEATAFNPRAVAALERVGLKVEAANEGENPEYLLCWKEMIPYVAFSKKYDAPCNPAVDFAAVLVCSEADGECPVLPGCEFRLALPFEDPKAYDGTPGEAGAYDEACRVIGRAMLYVMLVVKRKFSS